MRCEYEEIKKKHVYRTAEKNELLNINDLNIIINKTYGGWSEVDDDELSKLIDSNCTLDEELGEKAYQVGLATRNGRLIFEVNYEKLAPSSIYFFEFCLSDVCNLNCKYCSNNTIPGTFKMVDIEMGKLWIDRICEYVKEKELPQVTLEYTGGEPLINIDFITTISEYADEKLSAMKVKLLIVLATNLTVIGPKQIEFLKKFTVSIQASIDGPEAIHNANRPYYGGKPSFENIMNNLKTLNDNNIKLQCISSVITSESVDNLSEIAEFILSIGKRQMTLQPVQVIGRASEMQYLSVNPEYYADKLFEAVDNVLLPHWIKTKEKLHVRHIGLVFSYLLEPWRNYMCQRCPCGNSLTIISTNSNGEVYGCNQAPFNDSTILGNIKENSFIECQASENAKPTRNRNLDSIKECKDCLYRSFCQGGCSRTALNLHNDINTCGDSCDLNKALFKKGIEKLVTNSYPREFVEMFASSYANW